MSRILAANNSLSSIKSAFHCRYGSPALTRTLLWLYTALEMRADPPEILQAASHYINPASQ